MATANLWATSPSFLSLSNPYALSTCHRCPLLLCALIPLGSATSHFPRARVQGGTPSANCHSRKAASLNPKEENSEEWLSEACIQPQVGVQEPPQETVPPGLGPIRDP